MSAGAFTPKAALLPFIVASSRSASWAHVLQTYQTCSGLLKGMYSPTTEELKHGLAQMPTSWATSLFYYSVVKEHCGATRPDHSIVSMALRQFKASGNFPAMQRLLDEDVNVRTLQGAQASLVLASYAGMWERALDIANQQPKLKNSLSNRRLLIGTLCAAGQTRQALALLREDGTVDASPNMIRPIVKRLSLDGQHAAALRLAASSFACGYGLSPSLFSALLRSLRETRQAQEALESALELNLFSMPRAEAQRSISLFNGLVDCLYDMDPYAADYTVQEVVQEVTARMQPREVTHRPAARRQQFRLCTTNDMHRRFAKYVQPLVQLYGKCVGLSRWYSKPLMGLVDSATANDATVLVLDTNFLIQCVSKNLPLEHFHGSMARQYPALRERAGGVLVVVPFTVIEEAYTLIWNRSNRLRHSVRLLLWSRVLAFTRQPQLYVLSLTTELPTVSLSILTRMAYAKSSPEVARAPTRVESVATTPLASTGADQSYRDPDARVLNVCLFLHHTFRCRAIAVAQGTAVAEGTALFAFLKYHVRRYTNTVKGSACDRVLLCTMDKKLSRAATEAGVDCFPLLR